MKAVDVKIQLVDGGIMPKQATEGSAGLDLFACISEKEDIYIEGIDQKNYLFSFNGEVDESTFEVIQRGSFYDFTPNVPMIVSAGFKVELPEGYEMQIRQEVAFRLKVIFVLRTLLEPLIPTTEEMLELLLKIQEILNYHFHGDRIQAVIQEVPKVTLAQVDDLP